MRSLMYVLALFVACSARAQSVPTGIFEYYAFANEVTFEVELTAQGDDYELSAPGLPTTRPVFQRRISDGNLEVIVNNQSNVLIPTSDGGYDLFVDAVLYAHLYRPGWRYRPST